MWYRLTDWFVNSQYFSARYRNEIVGRSCMLMNPESKGVIPILLWIINYNTLFPFDRLIILWKLLKTQEKNITWTSRNLQTNHCLHHLSRCSWKKTAQYLELCWQTIRRNIPTSEKQQNSSIHFLSICELFHPNISIHILCIVFYTFPLVLTRRICLPIRSLSSWWSFPLFS